MEALKYKENLLSLQIEQANLTNQVKQTVAALQAQKAALNQSVLNKSYISKLLSSSNKDDVMYGAILANMEQQLKDTGNIIWNGGGITQNITINSPTPLSPSETARQIKNASRQLAMEW